MAWEAVVHALSRAPPIAAYVRDDELIALDAFPKRSIACAVLDAFRVRDHVTLRDALAKHSKSTAKGDPGTVALKVLAACHDAVRGRSRIAEDPDDAAWAQVVCDAERSMFLELAGLVTAEGRPTLGIAVPVTGTAVAKCLRDAGTNARAPPVLVVALLKKKAQRSMFVDYTMHFPFGGSEYTLCAVVCQATPEDVWAMADDGAEGGWATYRDGTRSNIHDMNALITKDAVVLVYKKKKKR